MSNNIIYNSSNSSVSASEKFGIVKQGPQAVDPNQQNTPRGVPKSVTIVANLKNKPQLTMSVQGLVASFSRQLMGQSPQEFQKTLESLGLTPENIDQRSNDAFKALGSKGSHDLVKQIASQYGLSLDDIGANVKETVNYYSHLGGGNFSGVGNVVDLIIKMAQQSNQMNFSATSIEIQQTNIVQNNMSETVKGLDANISQVKQQESQHEPIWKKALKIIVPIAIMVVATLALGPIGDLLGGAFDASVAGLDAAGVLGDATDDAEVGGKAIKESAEDGADEALNATDSLDAETSNTTKKDKVEHAKERGQARNSLDQAIDKLTANLKGAVDSVDSKLEAVKDYFSETKVGKSYLARGKEGRNYGSNFVEMLATKIPKGVKTGLKVGTIAVGSTILIGVEYGKGSGSTTAQMTLLQTESNVENQGVSSETLSQKVDYNLITEYQKNEQSNMSMIKTATNASQTLNSVPQ